MKAFIRTLYSTVEVTETRSPGFVAWTGFIAITLSLVFAALVWMAFTPEARDALAGDRKLRVAGIVLLAGAVWIAAQLVWTTRRGYVYCGRYDIITKARDRMMYRVYVTIHLIATAFMALWSILVFR